MHTTFEFDVYELNTTFNFPPPILFEYMVLSFPLNAFLENNKSVYFYFLGSEIYRYVFVDHVTISHRRLIFLLDYLKS